MEVRAFEELITPTKKGESLRRGNTLWREDK